MVNNIVELNGPVLLPKNDSDERGSKLVLRVDIRKEVESTCLSVTYLALIRNPTSVLVFR